MGDVKNQANIDNHVRESIPFFAEYLDVDRGTPPAYLAKRSTEDLGNGKFSKDRYISKEWHQLEKEKLWGKIWQVACRENDIPDVGDQLEHTIVDQSVIIVRSGPDEIKAFHNACRHRATPLVWENKSAMEFRCPFHAWTYDLDGQLKDVPCDWDFPEVNCENYSLKPVKTERWAGFVWVNLDPDAEPLHSFIPDELREQIEQWWPRRYWKAAHVKHVISCNWKLAVEAFCEVYHVPIIHPETIYSVGDYNSQYDFYGPHLRMCFTWATPSPLLGGTADAQDLINGMFVGEGAVGDAFAAALGRDYELPKAEPGDSLLDARQKIADMMKDVYAKMTGDDFSGVSDTELLDGYQYLLFPNFHVWGGHMYTTAYRWLPNGDDPESMTYEVMIFQAIPEGEPIPKDAPMVETPLGSLLTDFPGTQGSLGYLLDQDVEQLRRIQKGLHSNSFDEVTFSNEQERNLRNMHIHLERILGL